VVSGQSGAIEQISAYGPWHANCGILATVTVNNQQFANRRYYE